MRTTSSGFVALTVASSVEGGTEVGGGRGAGPRAVAALLMLPGGTREILIPKVFIGVDPHKLSATIEVLDDREAVLAPGRFGTDRAGYAAMRRHVAAYRDGSGRSRAATVPAGRWRSGCSPTGSTS